MLLRYYEAARLATIVRFIAGREEPATLAVNDELVKVVRHAERWVEENAPDSVKLVRRDAQWRDKAATDA